MQHLSTAREVSRVYAFLRSISILACAALATVAHAQCSGDNFFENGDFTGTEGVDQTAPGWVGAGTPDVNDEIGDVNTTSGYDWVDTPVASPSGGTWQNLTGTELVGQSVITVIGESYLLCFEHAQTGIAGSLNNYDNPFSLAVYIQQEPLFITPPDSNSFVWQTSCFEFVAGDTLTEIVFAGEGFQTYGAVDGACLTLGHVGLHGAQSTIPFTVFPDPILQGSSVTASVPVHGIVATDALGRTTRLPVADRTIDPRALDVGTYSLVGWTDQNKRVYARLLVTSRE